MKNKPDLKFTEMAMYVDSNVYKIDHDAELVCDYLVAIAYMLANKLWLFNDRSTYEEFAYFFAYSTYRRLTRSDQFEHVKEDKQGNTILNEDGTVKKFPPVTKKIKSCLNYMKSVIFKRKIKFLEKMGKCSEDVNTVSRLKEQFYERGVYRSQFYTDENSVYIQAYLDRLLNVVRDEVYKSVYAKDDVLIFNIYTSVVLSL